MNDTKNAKPGAVLTKPAGTPALPSAPPVSLKMLCAELKIEPRIAREKLRVAVAEPKKHPDLAKGRKSRDPWEWSKGSPAEKEARAVIAS